jgi:hypothetical protein
MTEEESVKGKRKPEGKDEEVSEKVKGKRKAKTEGTEAEGSKKRKTGGKKGGVETLEERMTEMENTMALMRGEITLMRGEIKKGFEYASGEFDRVVDWLSWLGKLNGGKDEEEEVDEAEGENGMDTRN